MIEVFDITAPELDVFARLTEAQLRNKKEPEKGVFIAESPKVILRALEAGCEPLSMLIGGSSKGCRAARATRISPSIAQKPSLPPVRSTPQPRGHKKQRFSIPFTPFFLL